MQPLGTKKITQHLRTKKNHASKIVQVLTKKSSKWVRHSQASWSSFITSTSLTSTSLFNVKPCPTVLSPPNSTCVSVCLSESLWHQPQALTRRVQENGCMTKKNRQPWWLPSQIEGNTALGLKAEHAITCLNKYAWPNIDYIDGEKWHRLPISRCSPLPPCCGGDI